MNRKNLLTIVLVALFATLGFLGVRTWIARNQKSLEQKERVVGSLNRIQLLDSKGRHVNMADVHGNLIVYLGYSHCPDMCPLALSHLRLAMQENPELQNAATSVFISVDPKRDSPDVLARYEQKFAPLKLHAFTGDLDSIQTLATDLGASFANAPAAGNTTVGEYGVNHSLFFYLIDSERHLLGTIPATASPGAIAAELEKIFE